MVVDSSALLAICFEENERAAFTTAILANDAKIAAPNFFEASMVVEARNGERGRRELDVVVANLGLAVVAFDALHLSAAREGFSRFGKGHHRAALNFGDCCAYGLAKAIGEPLLFKGNDFTLTDIERAL